MVIQMGDGSIPVVVKIEKKLVEENGLDQQSVNFGALTLESDNYLTIRRMKNSKQELLIFDLNVETPPSRKFVTAESAIMNPNRKLIALRQSNQLQLYDLDSKETLRSHLMTETVEFWTWISGTHLGIVTTDSVYHWDVIHDVSPVHYFNRDPAIFRNQIVGYSANLEVDWAFISALNVDKERRITGLLQLYCKDKNTCQVVNSHSGTFAEIVTDPLRPKITLLAISSRNGSLGKIKVVGVSDKAGSDERFTRCVGSIPFDQSRKDDFPIFTKFIQAYSLIFVVTKYSTVHAYDAKTCAPLFSIPEFCTHPTFACISLSDQQGIMAVTRSGKVYSIRVSGNSLIPYIDNVVKNKEVAVDIALRSGLSGAEDEIMTIFNTHINSGSYEEAAKLAAISPNGMLRTQHTINKLKSAPIQPSQTPPLLIYFKILLENSTLDYNESMELVAPAVKRKKSGIIQGWLNSGKLTHSEALGDVIMELDANVALEVYSKVNCHKKVVSCLIATSKFDEIQNYCDRVHYNPDYFAVLEDTANSGLSNIFSIAKFILEKNNPPKAEDLERIMDILLNTKDAEQNRNAVSFILGYMRNDRPEDCKLQTDLVLRSIELNPFAADAILASGVLTQYNRSEVAKLCESKGMYKRAILNYENAADIKRCFGSGQAFEDHEVLEKVASLPQNDFFYCLDIVAQSSHPEKDKFLIIALRSRKEINPKVCLSFLERHGLIEASYHYLTDLMNKQQLDEDLTYKYIEITCKLSRFEEAAAMCTTAVKINYNQVKDFLKSAGGPCCIPLVHMCDRSNLVEELIIYLYQRNEIKVIEYYVGTHKPSRTPEVIGYLIKMDCPKDLIEKLLLHSGGKFSLDEIIHVCEKYDHLPSIYEYLKTQMDMGNRSEPLYTALAKIYIEKGLEPEKFLLENDIYNPKVVGDSCRNINPRLALICYEKGGCIDDVISLTNENSMFKAQIEHLLPLSDQKIWEKVISRDNPYRDSVIDQIINGDLISKYSQNDASSLVRAFMNVAESSELLRLLEILVKTPKFNSSKNLRNLLILTSIKTDRSLVRKYLDEVDDFDAIEIANTATSKGYYDEAYHIYAKAGLYNEAIDIDIKYMNNMKRATELAERINSKDVWNKLIKGWLDLGDINACIETSIKSNNFSLYSEIIKKAKSEDNAADILKFIKHARSNIQEQMLDTEYALHLVRSNNIQDLKTLLDSPNLVDCNMAAEECFSKQLYSAAELLFLKVPNYHRHSETLLELNDLAGALESANKAKSPDLWLKVANICVMNGNFSIAEQAGLNIISKAEKLESLILLYESSGRFEEVISFLEAGIACGESANMNICTNLAILYCKYSREKLLPHIKRFLHNINVSKLVRACEEVRMWNEVIYMHTKNQEFDYAVQIMMRESGVFWNHQEFKHLLANAKATETCERAVKYYLEEHVDLLEDLLGSVKNRIDLHKLVALFRNMDCLPVIYPFLEKIRYMNNSSVNAVYNDMLIEKHDYKNLKLSIDSYTNFDQLELARKLENHENFEMRRISSYLCARNGRYSKSIEISLKDNACNDAISTVLLSSNKKLAESLLKTLAKEKKHCWFALMLQRCHKLADCSLVMELAWINDMSEYAMPFYIHTTYDLNNRIKNLEKALYGSENKPNENLQQTDNSVIKRPLFLPPPLL